MRKSLSLILVILLLFTSCTAGKENENSINLIDTGYSIRYEADGENDKELEDLSYSLQQKISVTAGKTMYIATSEEQAGEISKAILLKIDESLAELSTRIYDNGKGSCIISGGTLTALKTGVNYFLSTFLRSGSLKMTEGFDKTISEEEIDNSGLVTRYVSDSEVTTYKNESVETPDWFANGIMVEIRIAKATPEGTFQAAEKLLKYYAEIGVNIIWLTPHYEYGPGGNGYGNAGPHTVEPSLTGKSTYEESYEVIKHFVDEAHKNNIRVLLDIITWGAMEGCQLSIDHPEYFNGYCPGLSLAFDWTNESFKSWFIDVAVNNLLASGADGYRVDMEPNFAGYEVFDEIRTRMLDNGRKIAMISEAANDRTAAYDSEQVSVLPFSLRSLGGQYVSPKEFYLDDMDIVDSVKNGIGIGTESQQNAGEGGKSRYYIYSISNHDYQWRTVNGSRLKMGYEAIFSPFIPLWYMGDEFGITMDYQAVLYDVAVDFDKASNAENRSFLNDFKKMINIRLTYKEIFNEAAENHRDSNICKVELDNESMGTAYARYANGKGIIIIPNNSEYGDGAFTAKIPYSEMGINSLSKVRITNLLTGEVVKEGIGLFTTDFEGYVEYDYVGVYLIENV